MSTTPDSPDSLDPVETPDSLDTARPDDGSADPAAPAAAATMRRRRARRAAFATTALLGLTAVPVGASIILQNFVRGDVSASTPCMVKVAGDDATNASGLVGFDSTATRATAAGVNLLNETFTLKAMKGDRLTTTDGGRIKNDCAYPLKVTLKAEAQGSAAAISGDWTDLAATVYLGTSNGAASPDFTNAANWAADPITAKTGTAPDGTVVNDTTATITLAAGESARIAWVVDAGTNATATTASPATLRFTVTGAP